MKATRVFKNGKVYTVDGSFSTASAVAIDDNRIVYVGDDSGADSYIEAGTEVVDLGSKTVIPGVIDNHVHFRMYGAGLMRLSTKDKTKEQILADVKDAVAKMEPGQWLIGGSGFDNDWWDDPRYPFSEELDAVSPNNPVLLRRAAGGAMWCNSKALEAAGLTPDDDILKENALRNPDGTVSGCFNFAVRSLFEKVIPPDSPEQRREQILTAQKQLFEYGVVSIMEAMQYADDIEDIKSLYKSGDLKIRYYGALREAVGSNADEATHAYFKQCPEIGLFGGKYTVRAIKMMTCGTVGALSAAHYEEFLDDRGNKGQLNQTDEELYGMVKEAAEQGMQVITHSIGDRGIDQILDAYEKVITELKLKNHRFRIEHFQLVRGDTPERAKRLGIVPSMQAMHAPNSSQMAMRRLGAERASRAYAIGMVQRRVGMVAGGSDAPVAVPSFLSGMHASVTRQNDFFEPKGGFFPENGMTREDALRSYTIWGAYAMFDEDKRGSIETGKLADLVIMDKDIMQVDDHDILKINILETIVDGETVFKA